MRLHAFLGVRMQVLQTVVRDGRSVCVGPAGALPMPDVDAAGRRHGDVAAFDHDAGARRVRDADALGRGVFDAGVGADHAQVLLGQPLARSRAADAAGGSLARQRPRSNRSGAIAGRPSRNWACRCASACRPTPTASARSRRTTSWSPPARARPRRRWTWRPLAPDVRALRLGRAGRPGRRPARAARHHRGRRHGEGRGRGRAARARRSHHDTRPPARHRHGHGAQQPVRVGRAPGGRWRGHDHNCRITPDVAVGSTSSAATSPPKACPSAIGWYSPPGPGPRWKSWPRSKPAAFPIPASATATRPATSWPRSATAG